MTIMRSIVISAGLAMAAAQCEAPFDDTAALNPPQASTVEGRCTQYEDLLTAHAPPGGWDVVRMSAYIDREAGCDPGVRSPTGDSGLLLINDVNLRYLAQTLQEPVTRWTLRDPPQNVRAASQLCTYWRATGRTCYRAWGG